MERDGACVATLCSITIDTLVSTLLDESATSAFAQSLWEGKNKDISLKPPTQNQLGSNPGGIYD